MYYARRYGHIRFKEQVVVIESDDWGKIGTVNNAVYPKDKGPRNDWSEDRLETEENLNSLFGLLEEYANDFNRKPILTANFIVSNPDFTETKNKDYHELVLKPIDEAHPRLHKKWKEGIDRNIFYPQYHGRLHYNRANYLKSLHEDEDARFLFDQGINGANQLFTDLKQDYYSEYQDYKTDGVPQDIKEWVSEGLHTFERVFGFKSQSTVCPHYVVHPDSFHIFKELGVKYLQAGNKVLYSEKQIEQLRNYCLGSQLNSGIIGLVRNVKFEPFKHKQKWNADHCIQTIARRIKHNLPLIIDTHRINYTGIYAEKGITELRKLLNYLKTLANVHYLTSNELGEAIVNNGTYTDVFTDEKKTLTTVDSALKRKVRHWIN